MIDLFREGGVASFALIAAGTGGAFFFVAIGGDGGEFFVMDSLFFTAEVSWSGGGVVFCARGWTERCLGLSGDGGGCSRVVVASDVDEDETARGAAAVAALLLLDFGFVVFGRGGGAPVCFPCRGDAQDEAAAAAGAEGAGLVLAAGDAVA